MKLSYPTSLRESQLTRSTRFNSGFFSKKFNFSCDLPSVLELLCLFETQGLPLQLLLTWQPPDPPNSTFSQNHSNALTYLIRDVQIQPELAIKAINHLDEQQASALQTLYSKGLRREHLIDLKNSCEEDKENLCFSGIYNLLAQLIIDENRPVSEAIKTIEKMEWAELRELKALEIP